MLDILPTLEQWLNENRRIALATVVGTWGSSPRQPGAKMGITADTSMIGSVSGGCVEAAVVNEAVDLLADGTPRLLRYGVSDDTAWEVGLACGGRIAIYVEALDTAWWHMATQHVKHDQLLVTAMVLEGQSAGAKLALDASGVVFASPTLPPELRDSLTHAAQTAYAAKTSAYLEFSDASAFVDVLRPRPHLVMIGGAHVSMVLKDLAYLLGFRVTLIDPRQVFATKERFPNVELIAHDYPDEVLTQIGITSETYIAILTHDPKIDDPALRVSLPSAAPYVGILSSKRTHEKRIERLTAAGFDSELLKRIRTPIGLEIGAQTPEEIALCIMAEIIAVRNGVSSGVPS